MRIRGVKPFASAVGLLLGLLCAVEAAKVNKHKPWIETTYHGIVTENDDKVLLDPPLIALDKDAPLRYAESDSSEDEGGEQEDQQGSSRQQQLEWDDSTY
uniref:Calsyntenin-1-like n=1 Tax=Sinocyclocheilus rhinocerous TaxID=307959 RepID=A0A673IFL1_9TELE